MGLALLLVAALAVWQTVEVLHHSALCSPINRWAAATDERGGVAAFCAQAYRCPFCLSHWVALAVCFSLWLGGPLSDIVYVLAVTRLANLGNDIFYPYTKTPKVDAHDDADESPDPEAGATGPVP